MRPICNFCNTYMGLRDVGIYQKLRKISAASEARVLEAQSNREISPDDPVQDLVEGNFILSNLSSSFNRIMET